MVAMIINAISLALLVYSFAKSTDRTGKSLKITLKKGLNLAPWMIGIIVLIGRMHQEVK